MDALPETLKPILALSSCWLSNRHQDGYLMAQEMASLGFEYIELSHGIRITLVPGILRAVEEGVIRVGSCHNFCPLPPGILQAAPNLFQPSGLDIREHDQWVRHTKRSIDFAAQVKAGVLICHLGSISFFWFNPAARIERYVQGHPKAELSQDASYQKLKLAGLAKLRKRAPRHLEAIKISLLEVLEHASNRGIRLGFENREGFDELPLDDGFGDLFGMLPADAPVGYWHDTGHADIKEKMDLLKHRQHLEALSPRLLGFHLHDVSHEGVDHQELGTGRIDFGMVRSFWQVEHRLTLELSPRLSRVQVLASKNKVDALLGLRSE